MPSHVATALVSTGVSAQGLCASLRSRLQGQEPELVTLFASPEFSLERLARDVQYLFPASLILSSSTAGEFTEKGDAKGSVAAAAIAGDFEVAAGLGTGLAAGPDAAVDRALASLPPRRADRPHRTAIVLVDPLAGASDRVTARVSALLGPDVPVVGGAAGDDLRMARTVVGVGGDVQSDAVAIAVVDSRHPFGVGIAHGHVPLSCALRVTRAEGPLVFEIEGRPAWDVWRSHTRARAESQGLRIDRLEEKEEGAFLLRYEAELVTDGTPIRAPLSRTPAGAVRFATAIPQGTLLRITESSPSRQEGVAREAARLARASLHGRAVAGALVFDCICRNLILGPDFGAAMQGVGDALGPVPYAGFETYGEIAVTASAVRGFHNATSVVLAIPA